MKNPYGGEMTNHS